MLKKILKSLLNSKTQHRRYSSSRGRKHSHYGHPSKYGHKHYKKKYKSSGFFSRSYSSS